MTTSEQVRAEITKLIEASKNSLGEVKTFAISEAWKILQLLTAAVIQVIENIATDLSGSEKKELAMGLINDFYDTIFDRIDLPFLPSALESLLHEYIKKILMILVDSAIDALVATFKDVGVFNTPKTSSVSTDEKPISDFLDRLIQLKIARK
jgi:hypothetical protein